MLSEERVKYMTKMAMFEKKEGKKEGEEKEESGRRREERKKDYLSLCVLGNIFLATFIYMILCALVVGLLFSTILTNLHLVGLVFGVVLAVLLYVVYMYLYMGHIKKQYSRKYDEGVVLAKELRKDYQKLLEMYQQEEAQKTPEGWE